MLRVIPIGSLKSQTREGMGKWKKEAWLGEMSEMELAIRRRERGWWRQGEGGVTVSVHASLCLVCVGLLVIK